MTRLLVVDDHPIFRDGLAGLLATVPDLDNVRTAGSAEEALRQVADSPVDVVLMDINLPDASGVEATRQLTESTPATAVLMVTMVDDDDSVFAALAAGARGYVLKDATAEEILAAVRTVAAGGAVFGAAIATRILAQRPKLADARQTLTPTEPLTAREQDVLTLLAGGATNRQIARSLALSLKTVQNHVSHILDKLQAADRTQAVLRARGIDT
jgi:DNA-binding NarL/FixJ family response regulator